jgi:hypothetical protein
MVMRISILRVPLARLSLAGASGDVALQTASAAVKVLVGGI